MIPHRDSTPSSGRAEAATEDVQRLFIKHSGAIKGFILALLRNTSVAEDVLQETFLVVTAKADSYRQGSNFVAWACTIARFKVLETIRKNAREPHALSPEVIEALAVDAPAEQGREVLLRHLESCLTELPSSARTILRLRYFHTFTPEQIGQQLSLGTASVYVTLSRARGALRRCVESKAAFQS
jgi:RNA polymerase sigma-70 factor (ECF subfamily)